MVRPLPDIGPVRALGRIGRRYVFVGCRGEIFLLTGRKLTRNVLLGLFGGDELLRTLWRARRSFSVREARKALIGACEPLDLRITGPAAAHELRREGERIEAVARQLETFADLDPALTAPANVVRFPGGAR